MTNHHPSHHDARRACRADPQAAGRIFMWFFLTIQAIFIAWLISGIASAAHGIPADAHAQALAYCKGNGWSPLFKSYQDCIVHYANGMRGAAEVGSTIGAGLVIGLWVVTDVILGIGRLSRADCPPPLAQERLTRPGTRGGEPAAPPPNPQRNHHDQQDPPLGCCPRCARRDRRPGWLRLCRRIRQQHKHPGRLRPG